MRRGSEQAPSRHATLDRCPRRPQRCAASSLRRSKRRGQAPPPYSTRSRGCCCRFPGHRRALRAALFEVAAGLPDIADLGEVTDPLGRAGIAVVELPTTLVLDPTSSDLLAIEMTVEGYATWVAFEAIGPVENERQNLGRDREASLRG